MRQASQVTVRAAAPRFAGPRRLAAAVVALASDPRRAPALVLAVIAAHVVLWTVILTVQKAAQDVHMDVAEAFGWGQQVLMGYGKHPPLSGWVAGLWFSVFPVRDWASYALAMVTLGGSLAVCWAIARRVVSPRRAVLAVLLLAIYPIFNFKGFKYNADLLQLVTLPLVVLAYLQARARRSVGSGVLLGLAGVLAMMTKYWALTVIGAVGLAALIDPDRRALLRSPAPWVALAVFGAGMAPHVAWLVRADFAPLVYAGDVYELPSRLDGIGFALRYLGHNAGLLLAPLLALGLALLPRPRLPFVRVRSAAGPGAIDAGAARQVWWIQGLLAFGPALAAAAFGIQIKTDWGIPLFFLVPLAVLALPQLAVRRAALVRVLLVWMALTVVSLALAPWLARLSLSPSAGVGATTQPASQMAQRITELWQQRFHSRWAVVAGTTEAAAPMTFYSPDHPATLTPNEVWSSGLTSLEAARRSGFVGVCDTGDNRLPECEAWMAEHAATAEQLEVTARRFYRGRPGPALKWKVYLVPPA
jgi:hypothetical protein